MNWALLYGFFGMLSSVGFAAGELSTDILPEKIALALQQQVGEFVGFLKSSKGSSSSKCITRVSLSSAPPFADLYYTKYLMVDLEFPENPRQSQKNLFVWKQMNEEKKRYKNYQPFLKYWIHDEYLKIQQRPDGRWVLVESFKYQEGEKRVYTSLILNSNLTMNSIELSDGSRCELSSNTEAGAVLDFLPQEKVEIDSSSEVEYLTSYSTELRMLEMIQSARHEILAAYYIVNDNKDSETKKFFASLMEAATRGVKVKLLVDGIGMGPIFSIQSETLNLLKGAGVEVRIFHDKLDPNGLLNVRHRMHDKLLLADDQVIIGSSNIWSMSFYDYLKESDIWIKGVALRDARVHFFSFWESSEVWERPLTFNSKDYSNYIAENKFYKNQFKENVERDIFHVSEVRYVHDGVDKKTDQGTYTEILKLIQEAKKKADIVNSYVIPVPSLLQALKEAVQRGVQINVYTNSDDMLGSEFPLLAKAYNEKLPLLKEAGVSVWEYASQQMLHGKFVVIDDEKVYIGSQNLDPIAIEKNTENGIIAYDREGMFVKRLNLEIDHIRKFSMKVIHQNMFLIQPSRSCKACGWLDHLLYPLLESIL